jgi:hypothetical protein
LIYSTVVSAGTSPARRVARTAPVGHRGGKAFMKAMMAIACVCAAMLAVMGVMRRRNNDMRDMGKQRHSRWMRHS